MLTTDKPLDIDLSEIYKPHWGQIEVHQSRAKYKVIKAGRGWGKGICGVWEGIRRYLEWWNDDPPLIVVPRLHFATIVPTYRSGFQPWNEMKKFIPSQFIERVIEDEKTIYLENDCAWEILSAEKPDSMYGRGFDYIWMTEAASYDQDIWMSCLLPMTRRAFRHGCALIEGRPRDEDSFFERLWQKGQENDSDYRSWHFTTFDNPHNDREQIEKDAEIMPDKVFAQEYLAETQSDTSKAFRNYENCISGICAEPEPGRKYCLGVDLGKAVDFTVVTVGDVERRRVVAFDRFSQSDWTVQKNRILNWAMWYNRAQIILDRSGVGDPIYEDLCRMGVSVNGIKLHSPYEKQKLIEALVLALERESIRFPKWEPLIRELNQYRRITSTQKGTPARFVKYQPPRGYHDDCVISLALALKGFNTAGGWSNVIKGRNYATFKT